MLDVDITLISDLWVVVDGCGSFWMDSPACMAVSAATRDSPAKSSASFASDLTQILNRSARSCCPLRSYASGKSG